MARPRGVWKKLRKESTWSFTVSGRSWEKFLAASSARSFSRGSTGKVISATSSIAAGTAGGLLEPAPPREGRRPSAYNPAPPPRKRTAEGRGGEKGRSSG